MNEIEIDAEAAFGLMYELYRAKPWLNEPGVMQPGDAPAESEAVAFLLTAHAAEGWGACGPAARRVACTLLLDFTANLGMPGSPLSKAVWRVDQDTPPWRQALAVIEHEIRRSHPRLAARH